MTRERIAGLSPILFGAARDDVVAQSIIGGAADELAQMVAVLCRRLVLAHRGFSLALAGSVLLNQEILRNLLLRGLEARGCLPMGTSLVDQPVRGAIALARLAVKQF